MEVGRELVELKVDQTFAYLRSSVLESIYCVVVCEKG